MIAARRVLSPALLFVVVAASLPLLGCDLLKKLKGEGGEGETTPGNGTEADGKKGKASSGCSLPESVEGDVTIKKGCTVAMKATVYVRKGATLKIEPGVKINVDQGNYLWVEDGKLVAKGTEKEPIVFTSANKTQAEGDWVGIGFESKTQAGTELEWVHVEYAGANSSGGRAAIDIKNQSSPKRISISECTITHSAQAGIVNDSEKGGFAKFEKNLLKKNKNSLEAHSRVLGTVGAGNIFSDPLVTHGNVSETTTWPAVDQPIIVKEQIEIGGDKSPATLTIAPKTVLKVNPGAYLSVGTANGGSLIANNVTFTSDNGSPQPGDWVGIFVYARASVLQLDGAVIEYAGAEASGGHAAITFYGTVAKSVRGAKMTNATFRHNANAAMYSSDHDCSTFATGNKADGTFCRPD